MAIVRSIGEGGATLFANVDISTFNVSVRFKDLEDTKKDSILDTVSGMLDA
jgi:hypothetical protein